MSFLLIENIFFLGYSPKVSTDLLWWLTYVFTVVAIFYFLFSFFFKGKLNFGIKSRKLKKKELALMISQFLFMEESATLEEKEECLNLKIKIRELLKTKRNRKILAEVIVELRQDLSGESLKILMALYKDLGLDKDAYIKLKSWKWFTVSQGIFELTRMGVVSSYGKITKFINDRRSIIRKQAELSIVTLQDEGINYFLDTTDKNISEWQQLKILDILIKKPNFNPPSFKNWLASKNKDTILFCLRLIKYYNQLEAGNAIIKLIRHKDSTVRSEAVLCAKDFLLVESAETLKGVFHSSTNDCKLLIIDTLESFCRQDDIEFLQLVKGSKDAFAVKNKAGSAINSISPNTIINTMDLEVASNDYLTQLLNNQEEEEVAVIHPTACENDSEENGLDDDNLSLGFTSNEVQSINTEESKHKETEDFDEAEVTSDINLSIDDNVELNIEEIDYTSEPIHFEIEKHPEDTTDCKLTLEFDLENIESISEEENIVPIDDQKHIEFLEYMTTRSIPNVNKENIVVKEEDAFKELFFDKPHYEKFNLLAEIQDNGDEKEIPLLKAIIAEETNNNIKEKAVNILKMINGETSIPKDKQNKVLLASEPLILPAQTVFKDLYHSCDTEAKLILLKEIGALGDSIELKFLSEELSANEETIRKKAAEMITVIENRMASFVDNSITDPNLPKKNSKLTTEELLEESTKEVTDDSNNNDGKELIPLEFCFLLDDLEIKPSKESDSMDINFDISDEYFFTS